MQYLLIWIAAVVTASIYGVVHNQASVTVSPDFMENFRGLADLTRHSAIRLVAAELGVTTTWWVGAIVGVPLALVARLGSVSKYSAKDLLPGMALVASCTGVAALWSASQSYAAMGNPYNAASAMHSASYLYGILFGLVFGGLVLLRRLALGLASLLRSRSHRDEVLALGTKKFSDSGGQEIMA